MGSGGSIFFLTPSRPAMSNAANVKYGLQEGSGARYSIRFAFQSTPSRRRRSGSSIGRPILDPLRLRRLGVDWNAADRRAVALRVDQVDGRLEARHQSPVAVGGRRRECE